MGDFLSGFSFPAVSFAVPPGGTVTGSNLGIPQGVQLPATSFDPSDPGSYIPAIDNLGTLALGFLKQVQSSNNQGQLIAANPGAGGVVNGNGAAVGAAGALSTSSATVAGIPITYLIVGFILILLFRR